MIIVFAKYQKLVFVQYFNSNQILSQAKNKKNLILNKLIFFHQIVKITTVIIVLAVKITTVIIISDKYEKLVFVPYFAHNSLYFITKQKMIQTKIYPKPKTKKHNIE